MQDTAQVTWFQYIENDYGEVLAAAQRGGGVVHDGEVVGEEIHVGQALQANRIRRLAWVPVVDAVNPVLRHEQGVCVYLERPQSRPGICREERVARPRGEDDHPALLEVADRPAADVGLGYLLHLDGRLHAGGDAAPLERRLQSQGVDDRP